MTSSTKLGSVSEMAELKDYNREFYEQHKVTILSNMLISTKMERLVQSKKQLWEKLVYWEKESEFVDIMRKEIPDKKKRNRLVSSQVQRVYQCRYDQCQKSYGSSGSMLQHIKIKHHMHFAEARQKINGQQREFFQIKEN